MIIDRKITEFKNYLEFNELIWIISFNKKKYNASVEFQVIPLSFQHYHWSLIRILVIH